MSQSAPLFTKNLPCFWKYYFARNWGGHNTAPLSSLHIPPHSRIYPSWATNWNYTGHCADKPQTYKSLARRAALTSQAGAESAINLSRSNILLVFILGAAVVRWSAVRRMCVPCNDPATRKCLSRWRGEPQWLSRGRLVVLLKSSPEAQCSGSRRPFSGLNTDRCVGKQPAYVLCSGHLI